MPHTHEVELSDGVTVMTSEETPSEMTVEPVEPEGMEGALRLGGAKRTGDPEQHQSEVEGTQKALEAGDPGLLPPAAGAVWKRMFDTTMRWCSDERKSAALAWRGVRQKYFLEPKRSPKRRPAAEPRVKTFTPGTIAGRSGGGWLVRITEMRDAEVKYERTEQVEVPGYPGVAVTVGIGRANHRNLISVVVPDRYVSNQPGGVGAIKWVRQRYDDLLRAGQGRLGVRLTEAKRKSPKRRQVAVKRFRSKAQEGAAVFVEDPRLATEMIGFGEVYVPFEVDLQGEYATEGEVVKFAHGFMLNRGKHGEMHAAWEMKDGSAPAEVVETFIAREGDPDFVPGAWVMGVKYHPDMWEKVLAGEYTGFSIGGSWGRDPAWRTQA